MISFAQSSAKRAVAILVIATLFMAARSPTISNSEHQHLTEKFCFESHPLPEVDGPVRRQVRAVHPSLQKISAWISSVGAAVALADLDGDQLPNDVCYVDTRTDQVIVAPVPDRTGGYAPLVLDPGPQLFDRTTMAPMGCVPGDMNEDGLMDVLVYYWGRTPIVFLRKQALENDSPAFDQSRFVPREIVPGGERWYTNALTRADIDGDGHLDLIVGNYFQDGSRILDASASGTEAMQDSMSRAFNGGRNRLLLWSEAAGGEQPSVKFCDLSECFEIGDEPIATGWTLAIGAADLDGDLLPELYIANDFGPDRLLHNRSKPGQPHFALLLGRRTLTTPASKVLGHDSFKGMGVDFGDLNGDGLLDICVSNIAAEYALEESHFVYLSTGETDAMQQGIAPYVDASEPLGLSRSGWGWDVRLADFDNDGALEVMRATGFIRGNRNCWPELHEIAMGNDQLLSSPAAWHKFQAGDSLSDRDHNPFFVRAADGRYYDLAHSVGIGDSSISRGIATADVDGDGDLDIAVANQWEDSQFLRNDCPQAGSFLGLRLLHPVGKSLKRSIIRDGVVPTELSSTPAIGAAATIHLPDGRKLIGQVDGGNGHSGVRSPELHFGLGEMPNQETMRVELRWRDTKGTTHLETQQLAPGWHTIVLSNCDAN